MEELSKLEELTSLDEIDKLEEEPAPRTLKINIALNGLSYNPWRRWGYRQNPFPQINEERYSAGCLAIQKLGGDPIPDVAYIRRVLTGFTSEFVDFVCNRYTPGAYVKFTVTFPE